MKRSFAKFTRRLEAIGLKENVENVLSSHYVSLRDIYDGPHEASIAAARRAVYSWLVEEGKSVNEIARLFDRAPSGILKMTRERSI